MGDSRVPRRGGASRCWHKGVEERCRKVGTHVQIGFRVGRHRRGLGLTIRLSRAVLWPVLRMLCGIPEVGTKRRHPYSSEASVQGKSEKYA